MFCMTAPPIEHTAPVGTSWISFMSAGHIMTLRSFFSRDAKCCTVASGRLFGIESVRETSIWVNALWRRGLGARRVPLDTKVRVRLDVALAAGPVMAPRYNRCLRPANARIRFRRLALRLAQSG